MRPSAVLFDFDGVLADTENVHIVAWERTFGLLGWDVPSEDCARAAEVDDRAFLLGVFRARGIEGGDLDGWLRRKQQLTLSLLVDAPRIYPGVRPLLNALKGRARLAVVSTTWRANVDAVLDATGLAGAFERIVAKEDVSTLKPDPAAYLSALNQLGVQAQRAVALEDSATGLTAALAAGLPCLAVGHRRAPGDWSAQATFVPDLIDTSAVLEALKMGSTD